MYDFFQENSMWVTWIDVSDELHIEDIFQAIRINCLHRVATFLEFSKIVAMFLLGGRMFQKSSNIKLVIVV